jgi:hypothetical protein
VSRQSSLITITVAREVNDNEITIASIVKMRIDRPRERVEERVNVGRMGRRRAMEGDGRGRRGE